MTYRHSVATRVTCPADEPGTLAVSDVALQELLAGFSIEATPKQLERAGKLGTLLPAGTSVYVPFLPRATIADTARACARLTAQGLRPVPHVTARAVANRTKLTESLSRLAETGADSLLLIAGDRRRPAGPYKSTLEILDTGLLQQHGFRHIGVAGHPEGHPVAGAEVLLDALRRKSEYARETGSAMWIVTQFAFSAQPVLSWLEHVRDEGIDLPVRVGLPGPAKVKTLLRYAVQCGVAASSHMLARRPGAVSRLLGRWSPDEMLCALARYSSMAPQAQRIAGIHAFPFGGLLESIELFTRQ
jgi:methylenetetrahydrofolate reductase (NADPH)